MEIAEALRWMGRGAWRAAGEVPLAAFVGAGGKTTSLFRSAHQLARKYRSVIVTVTTHLATSQLSLGDVTREIERTEQLEALFDDLPAGVVVVTGRPEGTRVGGPAPELLEALRSQCTRGGLPLLIEADGSKMMPLKAPAPYEPATPVWVNEVVVAANLSGIGKPLANPWVHRPERYAALSGLQQGETVSLASLETVLRHPHGGLQHIPPRARRTVLLTGARSPELQAAGQRLAAGLLQDFDSVLVSEVHLPEPEGEVLAVHERTAGIVLAGGESRRLGEPKQLLSWDGEPFVRRVARSALSAGLSPVVVVTGAFAEPVSAAVGDLPVTVVHNPDWAAGQSGSIRSGLSALPGQAGAALFLLVDQPQVSPAVIEALLGAHRRKLCAVTAPLVDGRRANPVLFDRVTFAELNELSGDTGGRAIFSRRTVEWLPWHDSRLLLDVDTPEDYRRLLDETRALRAEP